MAFAYPFSIIFGGSEEELHPGDYSAEAYARQLQHLLPRGAAWSGEAGSTLQRLLLGIADELARVGARATAALREADPRTAVETLEDWERVFGLPDACLTEIPNTVEERQSAVTQRLASRGGQSRAFYVHLAASLGFYGATIDELSGSGLRVGFRAGDRSYGDGWESTWVMNLPADGPEYSRINVECVIRRAAPAHSVVIFAYV